MAAHAQASGLSRGVAVNQAVNLSFGFLGNPYDDTLFAKHRRSERTKSLQSPLQVILLHDAKSQLANSHQKW